MGAHLSNRQQSAMSTKVIPIIAANENAKVCKSCGGMCCKHMPGALIPADLGVGDDPEVVLAAAYSLLLSGLFSVYYVGAPSSMRYYLRPVLAAHIGTSNAWNGPAVWWANNACGLWSPATGCSLSAADRPSECKALVPDAGGQCHSEFDGKTQAVKEWEPYKEQLHWLFTNNPQG